LASGKPVTIREVVEKIIKITGQGVAEFGKIPYRVGENMALYADNSKAKELLGWRPSVTLSQGIFKTVTSYQKKT